MLRIDGFASDPKSSTPLSLTFPRLFKCHVYFENVKMREKLETHLFISVVAGCDLMGDESWPSLFFHGKDE